MKIIAFYSYNAHNIIYGIALITFSAAGTRSKVLSVQFFFCSNRLILILLKLRKCTQKTTTMGEIMNTSNNGIKAFTCDIVSGSRHNHIVFSETATFK